MPDKRGRHLFIAGAVLLLLLGCAHSLSLFEKPAPANETERQLMNLMSTYRFNLLGSMRSVDELERGFSISFILAFFCVGALDLALRREPAALLKRMALINAMWLATMSAVSLRYFFAAPTFFLVAALLAFALAWVTLPSALGQA